MNCSNTVKTYLKCQDFRIKWMFTHLLYCFTGNDCRTDGIESFLRNIDYQSMVVFLNMFFKLYHAQNPYDIAILDLDFAKNIR